LAKHRIYQYTSIGRPLEPGYPTNRTVLILLPVAAVVGAVTAWMDGQAGLSILQQAFFFLLIVFGAWALARELDPDDHTAAFVSMGIAFIAALAIESPDILIVFTMIVMLLVFLVIYATESPLFGAVAALAYILDGSLKEPLRHQWIFAMICLGGTVVYMVDHNIGLVHMSAPDSLFEWLAVLFLLIFALNTLLLKKVHAKDDVNGRKLDIKRVRGGMAVGLFAALQGIDRPDSVVIILASIAGICIGMAFRKGFKAPASG
jgi:hypothetical protein